MSKLKQLLFSLNETDRRVIEEKLKEKDQQIDQLKQQLAETKQKFLEFQEDSIRNEQVYVRELAEKDKEIEKLKQQYTILENENGKLTTELIMGKYKKAQKEVSFGKQLAIQELEKVKEDCFNQKELVDFGNVACFMVDIADVLEIINNQIKELSNNTFKCEICGEITPKNCEGGEPNVCAGCVPTETHDLSTEIEPQSHENDFLD